MQLAGFILAAGEGRRLRPATLVRPKALVPFCGIPLLELVASYLHNAGIEDCIVNACYQGERVYENCGRLNEAYGWKLKVSCEDKLLNSGGGLRRGMSLLTQATDFLVHNVDIVIDFDLKALIAKHQAEHNLVTVLLIPGKGPRTVSLDENGNILQFRDKENGRFTFSGVYILRRRALDYLPDDEEAPDIIKAFQTALDNGEKVAGLVANEDTFWSDIGTPHDYIRAHSDALDCPFSWHPLLRAAQTEQAQRRFELELQGVVCTGALGLGKYLNVPSGAHLHNVVLWDYTHLPSQLLYADGIYTGYDVQMPPPVDEARKPDKRIYDILGIDEASSTLEPLAKQGSGRKYCRISCGGKSWVWSAYNPKRIENSSFAAISDFLTRLGINVPKVYIHLADKCELVSQDLGQNDLHLMPENIQEDYLKLTVEQVARLHVLGARQMQLEELPLQRGFTKGLYNWERDYFRTHILEGLFNAPELWGPVAKEYNELRSRLLCEPLVPLHRDLQSANIKELDGKVYLIDFQGMRLGAAGYDLGALLFDPYQKMPHDLRQSIWNEYCRQVKLLGAIPPADEMLPIAACQRLLQCLGAYGKLWKKDGLEWYRQFIKPGLEMLVQASTEAGIFPNLTAMAENLLERVAPVSAEA
ncbi:MAG: NTP transferase domain-containing protein, partial [Victivallales bacterium]|nr:NTP transferase domain-containing protein [Victivallales bacterium]